MQRKASLMFSMLLISFFSVNAQPVLTPMNVALGGGGSTYITDYNANFYNPANLFIEDRLRAIDLGFAISGTYFNGVQNFTDLNEQRDNFEKYIYASCMYSCWMNSWMPYLELALYSSCCHSLPLPMMNLTISLN